MTTRRDGDGVLDLEPLRLVLVTDGAGDAARLERTVAACVDAGLRCVQLREPSWSAAELARTAERLRPRLDAVAGLLLVNDRVDVAASGCAHGAHLGARSLPLPLARRALGPEPVLSFSAHDQDQLAAAHRAGCDWAFLSPVWVTTCKPGHPGLGEPAALALTRAAELPVVWLGGIDAPRAERIRALGGARGPVGAGVRSGIMAAADPAAATRALLRALGRS